MAKTVTSQAVYKSAKIAYKDPIQLLHFLYNLHCDPGFKMDIKKFQGMLSVWLLTKQKQTLLNGSLKIIKYFDSKFAQ